MAITVKNISSSLVYLSAPQVRFSRSLNPGRTIPVTQEEYDELTSDSGFMALVRGHYIKIEGVEEEKQVEIIDKVYDKDEIEQMIIKGNVTAFAKFIPTATAAEKETAIATAVEHKVTNNAIVALIKKYCNVDIISVINANHEMEEK